MTTTGWPELVRMRASALASFVLLMLASPMVFAQVDVASVPATSPVLHENSTLPTVLVTARRDAKNALEVPISLVVLDGDALADARLSSATDLQERVPGLNVTVPSPRITSFSIRGLGSNAYNDGLESSVGLYIDGVYLTSAGMSVFDFIDIDHIEVLRGPQGTLFGKSTTAGVINVFTKPPSQTFESTLEASFGNNNARQYRGSVTGPLISGTLAGRLTGYLNQRDGFITNLYDGSKPNNRDRSDLRGQLLWTPMASLRGRFTAEYGKVDEDCCVFPLVAPVRRAVSARDDYMEYRRSSPNPYDRVSDNDSPSWIDSRQKALSAEFVWDASADQQLTSLSAWRDWNNKALGVDATSLKLVNGDVRTHFRQFSQEFRLNADFKNADAVFGLYYLHLDIKGSERALLGADLTDWVFGGLIREQVPLATQANTGTALHLLIPRETLDGTVVYTPYTQSSDSIAGYASINWHLTDRFDITTGLRYTHDYKSSRVIRSRSGGNPGASPLSLTDNLTPLGNLIGQDLSAYTFAGIVDGVAGGTYARDDVRNEGNVSGQLLASYKISDEIFTYASLARGYKAGGINLGVIGETLEPTFKSEIATAYEIGGKGRIFDNRLSYALAVYQTQIKNYQALTFDEDGAIFANPRQTNLLNVGSVRLRGVELESSGLIFDGLLARAGIAYSQAITTDFKNAPNEDTRKNTKDLSGQQLYNAPIWSGNAGLEYSGVLSDSLRNFAAVDYSFKTGTYATVEHGRASYVDGYGLTNVRLGLRHVSGWDLTVWTRNLFDTEYIAGVYPIYGVGDYGAFAGDPRTYGLTLRATF